MSETLKTDTQQAVAAPLPSMLDITPEQLKVIQQIGTQWALAGLFGCQKPEQGIALATICALERQTPTRLLRTYHYMSGTLAKKARAAHAEFVAAGGIVRWIKTGDDGNEASAEFEYGGQKITLSYTRKHAEQAGLIRQGSGWAKNPADMLQCRLLAKGIRMLAPHIYAGEGEEEEAAVVVEAPARTLNLAPAAEPAEKVMDEIPMDGPTPLAKATAAPAVDVQPAPAPETPKPAPTPVANSATPPTASAQPATRIGGTLPDALQQELIAAIGGPDRISIATEFLWHKQVIPPGTPLDMMSEKLARNIIKKGESLRRHIAEFEAQKGGGAK